MERSFQIFGILSDKKIFVEATREDLIAQWVGHTAIKTKEIIDKAKGGVLFIDEAYAISNGSIGNTGVFEKECIETLIKEMENNRDDLCVILAGYKDEMQELLNSNTGFRSRIQFNIDFPDYTEYEMLDIFEGNMAREIFALEENCEDVLLEYFRNESGCKDNQFGNGRLVRNLFEKIKFEQAMRIKREKSKDLDLIKKEDILNVIENVRTVQIKKSIGFAC